MAEHDDLRPGDAALLDLLRDLRPEDRAWSTPPTSVWAAIEQEVGLPLHPSSERPRRRRLLVPMIGAVAAAAAIATAVVLVARSASDPDVVATAALSSDGLTGAPAGLSARAELLDEGAARVLHVDVGRARPASGEYLELWLIRPDISGMVSLGAVRPDGEYDLPPGLEVSDYPVVDVSTEPYDGDPAHSGVSLLRGVLDAE